MVVISVDMGVISFTMVLISVTVMVISVTMVVISVTMVVISVSVMVISVIMVVKLSEFKVSTKPFTSYLAYQNLPKSCHKSFQHVEIVR